MIFLSINSCLGPHTILSTEASSPPCLPAVFPGCQFSAQASHLLQPHFPRTLSLRWDGHSWQSWSTVRSLSVSNPSQPRPSGPPSLLSCHRYSRRDKGCPRHGSVRDLGRTRCPNTC